MGIEDRSEEGEDPIKDLRTRKWQSRSVCAANFSRIHIHGVLDFASSA
jgi:hypothetical protein